VSARAADEVRVRYGRARLTVATGGRLDADDPLGRAIDEYERGEARATTVARAYLRSRVVDHSPSFSWRNAKLSELIPLVTSVSAGPRLEAQSSAELADELVRLRTARREPAPAQPPPPPPPEPAPPPAARARPRPTAPALRRWVPALALVACAMALAWGIARLAGGDDEASEVQRTDAAAAATAVADSMDYVYSVYDLYVGGLEREALARAIAETQTAIATHGPAIEGELEPEGENEEALASAASYLDEASEFLDRLETTLREGRDAVLANDEGIYRQSVRLARQAEQLEEAILSLGSGGGDESQSDHYRPRPPD
jgi:hypothetical protein